MPRAATIARKTKETDLRLTVDLDGDGEAKVETGIPFFYCLGFRPGGQWGDGGLALIRPGGLSRMDRLARTT